MSPQELFNLSDSSFFYRLNHLMTKKREKAPNELFFTFL